MNRIIIALFIFLLLIPNYLFGADNLIIDIYKIAGKTELQISEILGNPITTEKTKQGPKCIYKNEIEIVFIKNQADWITVNNMGDALWNQTALTLLGIKPVKPSFSNENTMNWDNFYIPNLREVMLAPKGNGKISYAYIKAFTK